MASSKNAPAPVTKQLQSISNIQQNKAIPKQPEPNIQYASIKDLNEEQKEAALCKEKRILVLAGAGSGKTKTLIQKIIHLIFEEHVDSKNILAITFTKNAANEMIDRLIQLADGDGQYAKIINDKKIAWDEKENERRKYIEKYPWLRNLEIKTFHSFCYQTLRKHGAKEIDNKFKVLMDDSCDDDINTKNQAPEYQEQIVNNILFELCKDEDFRFKVKGYILDWYVNIIERMHERGSVDYEKRYVTLKGDHVCSKFERDVADWLYRRGIDYTYEPKIGPIHFEFKPDFFINDANAYLELISNKSYPIEDKKKEMLESGKTYLTIREQDTYDTRKFNEIIEQMLIPLINPALNKVPMLKIEEEFKSYGKDIYSFNLDVLSVIDKIKVENFDFAEMCSKGKNDKYDRVAIFYELFEQIYKKYDSYCTRKSYLDFNDFITKAIDLLEKHPDVKNELQKKFKYILVDEFQDVNTLQVKLLENLLTDDSQLFCVGDDWQSIYGWRGSQVEYIVNFKKYFENPKIIKLTINYRSNDTIVNASNEVIKNNKFKIEKEIRAYNKSGKKIYLYAAKKEIEDGVAKVKETVSQFLNNGYSKENILVLARRTTSEEFKKYRSELRGMCRVVTMHAAKGLEAKVVFIIGLTGRYPYVRDDDRIFQIIKKSDYQKAMEEERRLFYVALTRAKEELFLISEVGSESDFIKEIPGNFVDRTNFLTLNIVTPKKFCCKKCSTEIEEEDIFCRHCGINLSEIKNL
jgi:DNA helicase-4